MQELREQNNMDKDSEVQELPFKWEEPWFVWHLKGLIPHCDSARMNGVNSSGFGVRQK